MNLFSNKVISIDIGSYQIKVVVGKFQKDKLIISHAFLIPTPANVLLDGEITDSTKISSAISNGLKEKNIKAKKVIYTLQSTTVITREVDFPSIDEEDLEKMLHFEVQQFFPTSLDEYVIQYKVLKKLEEDNGKTRLLVAALPKTIVHNYMELSKSLNLTPIALDIHSNSISKLFMKGVKLDDINHQDNTMAVVDLGYEGININIIKDGVLEFSRLLPVGGKDIDTAIANTFNFTLEDSEERKKLLEMDSLYTDDILEISYSCIDGWVEEMERIFKYHTSRSPGNRINQIYLMGGHANLKGVANKIEESFNIPTRVINHLSNIQYHYSTIGQGIDQKCFLNAMGAIIRK